MAKSWCALVLLIATWTSATGAAGASSAALPYQNPELDIEARVEDLLSRMTLEEKVGQLMQIQRLSVDEELKQHLADASVGSVLGTRDDFMSVTERNRAQELALEGSRLGIPLLFGHDVVHGCETIFPLCLAQSCSWSPALVRRGARIAAREAAARGIDWTFAPMLDVSRDPRWGRVAECFGEDHVLTGVLARAFVEGAQGADLDDPETIAACLKHYVGYGAALGGRDYQYTEISERTLREVYLPPFQEGVKAGAQSVMSAFNDIAGIPATANPLTLTTILRSEWRFDGVVVSDWGAVRELVRHGFAADEPEAGRKALLAGVDMEMVSRCFDSVPRLVAQGLVAQSSVDAAVRRVLRVKLRLDLFERPFTEDDPVRREQRRGEHARAAREAAGECMVLLKNDHAVLPLQARQKVAVVGPWATSQDQLGWWTSLGDHEEVVTVLQGFLATAPDGMQITQETDRTVDVVVVCVGEEARLFGENNCRSKLGLPEDQEALVEEYSSLGKPVVLVVFNGRPLDLTGVVDKVDALLLAWHPGTQGGNAVADVLLGTTTPSAKLSMSFPRSVGQLPVYYNHRASGRPQHDRYKDLSAEPLFPFGFGLSYTTFAYRGVKLDKAVLRRNETLEVTARISNTGEIAGSEVVQLYVHDVAASATQPVRQLKDFHKLTLAPHETRAVRFTVHPEQLAVLTPEMTWQVEPGLFEVWVAPDSRSGEKAQFKLVE